MASRAQILAQNAPDVAVRHQREIDEIRDFIIKSKVESQDEVRKLFMAAEGISAEVRRRSIQKCKMYPSNGFVNLTGLIDSGRSNCWKTSCAN